MISDAELLKEFVADAKEHIETIEAGLIRLEQGCRDTELMNAIFRAAHSVKGTAGFFNLTKIVQLSHSMENLLGKIRDQKVAVGQPAIDALLAADDQLKKLVNDVSESEQQEITGFLQRIDSILPDEKRRVEPSRHGLPVDAILRQKYGDSLKNMAKHGRKFYRLTMPPTPDKNQDGEADRNIVNSIQSIGTSLAHYFLSDKTAVFLFSTVLEPELAVMALGVDAKQILAFDLQEQEAEIYQMLEEAEAKNAAPAEAPRQEKTLEPQEPILGMHADERIKVDVALLDGLVNLSSEMVLVRNQLLRIIAPYADQVVGLQSVLQKLDHNVTIMQEKVMGARMQPVANLLHSAPRLVRELAKKLGKELTLDIQGEQVELDKSIIEALVDPFTHLLRNALDHGIETPEVRRRVGKKPQARLTIHAYRQGGRVILDLTDDGAGIDEEKIRHQAIKRKIASREEVAKLSEGELFKLLFLPGFSTSSTVSDISGRGVGLDVVRSNIERLGGKVEIFSKLRKGTTFRLTLPLTLAILPSLIVESAGLVFALPQVSIQEIVRLDDQKGQRIEVTQGCKWLRLREQLIPVARLVDLTQAVTAEPSKSLGKVLVIKSTVQTYGLLVDKMGDQEEVLVKPLPTRLQDKQIYSGVTILGDGRIAVVLDADGIAGAAMLSTATTADKTMFSETKSFTEPLQKVKDFLLFDGFAGATFALPVAEVSRIEEISPEKIEKAGEVEYCELRGKVWRLIRPERSLAPAADSSVSATRSSRIVAIIPKQSSELVAVITPKVRETVSVVGDCMPGGPQAIGILGSIAIHGKMAFVVQLDQFCCQEGTEQQKVLLPSSAAGDQQEVRRILTFYLGSDLYGIDLTAAKEISRISSFTPILGHSDGFVGLLNLRGQVISLFDIAGLLPKAVCTAGPRHCVILKDEVVENAGFLVDRLGDVVAATADMMEPFPQNSPEKNKFPITTVVRLPEQVLMVLDMKRLLDSAVHLPQ